MGPLYREMQRLRAFLSSHEGCGHGNESAFDVISHAAHELGITYLPAIATPGNRALVALLQNLGFDYVRVIDENGEKLNRLDSHPIRSVRHL